MISSRILWLAVAALTSLGFGGFRPLLADTDQYDQALNAWTSVLQQQVDPQGRVDFEGIRAAPGDLDEYLNYIAEIGPLSSPQSFPSRDKRVAYYLNAYNALAMRKVVDFGIPEEITGLKKLRFFALSRVKVDGKRMSLYRFENAYIRAENDPRVHFALNCMAVSCPRLPREAFVAGSLDTVLDSLARDFFAERRNLYVDREQETVYVSEILDFFQEDFLSQAPTLIDYINQYVDPNLPQSYSVEFIDYDWRVNKQPGENR